MLTICEVLFHFFLLTQSSVVIIRVCFLASSNSYQNKRDKSTRCWLSAKVKTFISLRGKPTHILLIEILIVEYQDQDPWPSSHAKIKAHILLTVLFKIFIIVWILRSALTLRSFILDTEIFIAALTLRPSLLPWHWDLHHSDNTNCSYNESMRLYCTKTEVYFTVPLPSLFSLMTVIEIEPQNLHSYCSYEITERLPNYLLQWYQSYRSELLDECAKGMSPSLFFIRKDIWVVDNDHPSKIIK